MKRIQRKINLKEKLFLPIVIIIILSVTLFILADEASFIFVKMKKKRISASSTLVEKGRPVSQYAPNKAFDGKLATAWCEGKDDAGIGESIDIKFKPTPATGISILNGFGMNRSLYFMNNRVKDFEMVLLFSSGEKEVIKKRFPDNACGFQGASKFESCEEMVTDSCSGNKKCIKKAMKGCKNECIMDGYDGGGWSFGFQNKNGQVEAIKCLTGLKLKILSVYPGKKFNDTCVAEVSLQMPLYYDKKLAASCR